MQNVNKGQVSYMMFRVRVLAYHKHHVSSAIAKLSQSNIPEYTNAPTFPGLYAFSLTFAEFPDVSRNSRKVATLIYIPKMRC